MDYHARKKLSRLAKVIDVIAIVMIVLWSINACTIAHELIFPSARGYYYELYTRELDLGEVIFKYNVFYDGASMLPDKQVLDTKFYFDAIYNVVYSLLLVFVGWMMRRMAKPLKKEKPFSQELSKNFKILAIVIFVSTAVLSLSHSLVYYDLYEAYNIPETVMSWRETETGGGAWLYSNYDVESSGLGLVTGLFMWILSILFKHGEKLQVQSDETL